MIVEAAEISAGDYIKLDSEGLHGTYCVHVKEFPEGDEIGVRIMAQNLTDRRVVLNVADKVEVVRPWPGHRNSEEA